MRKDEITLSMMRCFDEFLNRKNKYCFDNSWRINAPLELIWDELINYKKWPVWCDGLKKIEHLGQCEHLKEGNCIRSIWKGALPYTITFDSIVREFTPYSFLSFNVTGDLCGDGICCFSSFRDTTDINFIWNVSPGKFWMKMSSPFVRSVFIENHDYILARAVAGFARMIEEKSNADMIKNPVNI